jgi:hypothetical protein
LASDGKDLELLVAFVEETLVPQGFSVSMNKRVFDDEGNQIAEFDVEVSGKLGSTDVRWLIECRDRPSSGAAPVAWIEQLVGRRDRFRFSKVTAVSTTRFASEARNYAERAGIEVREVKTLSPEEFWPWLQLSHMTFATRVHKLDHAKILLRPPVASGVRAGEFIAGLKGDARFLKSSLHG